ncbi:hypothetical protein LCL61_35780 [Amycolatopsis coloradensis]|uniref:Uncharacterized protein n=1 Tax=Amycolatopsis coloradensis TaxID=76021 RepID=A0ACD5BND7_9PSEU
MPQEEPLFGETVREEHSAPWGPPSPSLTAKADRIVLIDEGGLVP